MGGLDQGEFSPAVDVSDKQYADGNYIHRSEGEVCVLVKYWRQPEAMIGELRYSFCPYAWYSELPSPCSWFRVVIQK